MTMQDLIDLLVEITGNNKLIMLDALCDGQFLGSIGLKNSDTKLVEDTYNFIKDQTK